jgi:putative N6-adenine-specific DNA methylase
MANINITEARLSDTVEVSVRDFLQNPAPVPEGTLIINPPYGHRIGGEEMGKFYGDIGTVLKHNYNGYTAWILSGDKESFKSVALKPFRKIDLLNGDIECRLQGYELYQGSRKTAIAHRH